MGQKVNPKIIRMGYIYDSSSRWFNEKRYSDSVIEDYNLRKALMERLKYAGISRVDIERSINSLRVIVYVSRPGIVIGRSGTGLEDLKKFLASFLKKTTNKKNLGVGALSKLDLRIEPIKEPNLDATLVAKNIADQLNKRLPFKRVLVQTGARVMDAGANGVKIMLSGRIAGAEIGRREKIQLGTVPLSTLREKIDFASFPALTKKGYIGVKVWINKK
ncbi:30S ribosomal protein S3 [Patescibacteria group bacterium]|nr:30S ribosomal protein S3 [Patescibacteria group bacterium]MCL5010565.1 30S ribosomal protein S3 [Patescibacteria group bacterium]